MECCLDLLNVPLLHDKALNHILPPSLPPSPIGAAPDGPAGPVQGAGVGQPASPHGVGVAAGETVAGLPGQAGAGVGAQTVLVGGLAGRADGGFVCEGDC